jgi:hypothetical protein
MLKPVLVGCDDLELDENRMRAFYCEDDRNDKEATYRGTSGTRGPVGCLLRQVLRALTLKLN